MSAVRFEKSCDDNTSAQIINTLHDRITSVPLYEMRFFNGDKFYRLALFAFVDGGFRFIIMPKFNTAPSSTPVPASEKSSNEAASDVKMIRLGGNVAAAKLIKKVAPAYPELARSERLQGTVRFHAIIAKDGSIRSLHLETGVCSLAEASFEAIRQWRYQPTLLRGQPVEVDTTIDAIFSLRQ